LAGESFISGKRIENVWVGRVGKPIQGTFSQSARIGEARPVVAHTLVSV
jgi:hypothetical protein